MFSQIHAFDTCNQKLTSSFLDLWCQENNVSCMQLHYIYSALIFIIHFLYIESLSLMDRMKIKVPNNEVEKES